MRLFVAEVTGLVKLWKVTWAVFSHMYSNVHRSSGRYWLSFLLIWFHYFLKIFSKLSSDTFTWCCALVVLELPISATSLRTGVLRYLWGAPGFPFSFFSLASALMFDWSLGDSVCYYVGRFLLLLLLFLLFCTFAFVCFAGLACSCREAAVTGRPGCWFPLLCSTWENSSLSTSTGESNSLQLHGHLPEYITLLEGFGVFCLFVFTKTLL